MASYDLSLTYVATYINDTGLEVVMARSKRERGLAQDIERAIKSLEQAPRKPNQKPIGGKEVLERLRGVTIFAERLETPDSELGPSEPAQLRRIQRKLDEIRKARGIEQKRDPLDEPFNWDLFPRHDLPWEANGLILRIWAYEKERHASLDALLSENDITISPTWRKVRWWWKVHTAIPQPGNIGDGLEAFVYEIAEVLWLTDWYKNVVGTPDSDLDLSGNWAYLAYRGWDPKHRATYQQAINDRRIEPVKNVVYQTDGHGDIVYLELVPGGIQPLLKPIPHDFSGWVPQRATEWVFQEVVKDEREIPDAE